jgi:arabinose-5-phosphate isomerase
MNQAIPPLAARVSDDARAVAAVALGRQVLDIEAAAVAALARRLGGEFSAAVALIRGSHGRVIVSGIGKSGHIARKLAATFASTGTPAYFVHAAEAVHGDLGMITRDDVLIAISNSGENDELLTIVPLVKRLGGKLIAITGNEASSLAQEADIHLDARVDQEACPLNLAPTASTTAMLAMGDALALAVSRRRNFAADDFHRRHPGGTLGAGLKSVTEVLRFRVGETLNTVREDCTVADALRTTGSGRRAGALVIVDAAGRLSGIFTDGDLRRRVNELGAALLTKRVSEVMTARPSALASDALVRDAVQLVRERRLDEIPVVDGEGRPLGLIDVQDLVSMKVIDLDG